VPGSLRVTQVKSTISHIARNRSTIRALGLHGIGSSVEIPDNDATRGMVRQVRFLVTVEAIEGGSGAPKATARSARRSRPATDAADAADAAAPNPEPAPARRPRTRASAPAADAAQEKP
jgi:large subunit ribosomal protein L30